jgi:hypothetical protein
MTQDRVGTRCDRSSCTGGVPPLTVGSARRRGTSLVLHGPEHRIRLPYFPIETVLHHDRAPVFDDWWHGLSGASAVPFQSVCWMTVECNGNVI